MGMKNIVYILNNIESNSLFNIIILLFLIFSLLTYILYFKKNLYKANFKLYDNKKELEYMVDLFNDRNNLVNSILDNANLIILVWKEKGILLKFNNYAQILTGFKEDEMLGLGWDGNLVDNELKNLMMARFGDLSKGIIPAPYETYVFDKSGDKISILWNNSIIYDKHNKPSIFIAMGTDISARKNAEEKLVTSYKSLEMLNNKLSSAQEELKKRFIELHSSQESLKEVEKAMYRLAYYDPLTNLPNRTLLNLKLENELKKAKSNNTQVGLLYMDLDNFKSINDTFGHSFGDKLLVEVAKSFQSFIDKNMTISRLGGDEFLIIIPNIKDINCVTNLANEVLKSLCKPFIVNGLSTFVTTSIGIVIFPIDGTDIQNLFKNADTTMYHAKSLGKNTYQLFSKEINDNLVKKMELEKILRFSLLNCKESEFSVYYQPQIDVKTSELVGLEALVRWHHPKYGFISPNEFIPLAEERGLVNEIDEFVLNTTCNQLKEWQNKGYKLVPVSVNISANQFKQQNLFEKIQEILNKTKLSSRWLHIEITESATICDMNMAIKILNKFKAIGVKVLLDDFGTGYSSLNHLKYLPINTLKIDKSFVDQIAYCENEKAIANTLIQLAHNLNMDVIAEGVETKEQLEVLKSQKCDTIQGYFFSKPLPSNKLESILKCSYSKNSKFKIKTFD